MSIRLLGLISSLALYHWVYDLIFVCLLLGGGIGGIMGVVLASLAESPEPGPPLAPVIPRVTKCSPHVWSGDGCLCIYVSFVLDTLFLFIIIGYPCHRSIGPAGDSVNSSL